MLSRAEWKWICLRPELKCSTDLQPELRGGLWVGAQPNTYNLAL